MKRTLLTLFMFLLVFSFAAQAVVVETTWWSATSRIFTRGIAAGSFDEATQTLYAATSDNGDSTPDQVWAVYQGNYLVLAVPSMVRATYIYNVPSGGIAGQADAAMYLSGPAGVVAITEPTTLGDGGIVQEKITRALATSGDITNTITSRNILPAGTYTAMFEFRIPGFAGTTSRELRADSISGARLVSIRLETVSSGGAAKSSGGGGSAPQMPRQTIPRSIPKL